MVFNASEILDRERQTGTLGNLFVAPAPRFSWLAGFQLFAVTESLVTATLSVAIGKAVFGLPLDIAPVTLLVTMTLFIASMWGFSMILGAVGRGAAQRQPAVEPGLPDPAARRRDAVPDRADAGVDPGAGALPAVRLRHPGAGRLGHAGCLVVRRAGELWPLAGFAVALPLLGIAAFRAVERRTRVRGTLELV